MPANLALTGCLTSVLPMGDEDLAVLLTIPLCNLSQMFDSLGTFCFRMFLFPHTEVYGRLLNSALFLLQVSPIIFLIKLYQFPYFRYFRRSWQKRSDLLQICVFLFIHINVHFKIILIDLKKFCFIRCLQLYIDLQFCDHLRIRKIVQKYTYIDLSSSY